MDLKKQNKFLAAVHEMRLLQKSYWITLNRAKESKGPESTKLFNEAKNLLKQVVRAEKKVDGMLYEIIPRPHPWRIGAMDDSFLFTNHY